MRYCENFMVADKALLIPDEGVEVKQTDLDSSDTGRDESGIMHRQVVRRRVRTWSFVYSHLTSEEYQYMESLFNGQDQFEFTFPNPDGSTGKCNAYCSNNSITINNIRTGIYKNYKFNIIEC